MDEVDRQDQLMAYYPCERKCIKCYKKLDLHILQMLLLNSYLLFKKRTKSKMTMYDFRISIIESLGSEKAQTPLTCKDKKPLPHENPVGNNGTILSRRCVWCYKNNKKSKETTFHCNACESKPDLCVRECFVEYHAKL